jgi:hypothetical protein
VANSFRIRVELWSNLRKTVEREMEELGLTASEVINLALLDYYGLSTRSNQRKTPVTTPALPEAIPSITIPQVNDDEDDFL